MTSTVGTFTSVCLVPTVGVVTVSVFVPVWTVGVSTVVVLVLTSTSGVFTWYSPSPVLVQAPTAAAAARDITRASLRMESSGGCGGAPE